MQNFFISCTSNGKFECHSIKFTDGKNLFWYVYKIMDCLTYRSLTWTCFDVCKCRVFALRFKSLRSNESAFSTFIQNKKRDLRFSRFFCELLRNRQKKSQGTLLVISESLLVIPAKILFFKRLKNKKCSYEIFCLS